MFYHCVLSYIHNIYICNSIKIIYPIWGSPASPSFFSWTPSSPRLPQELGELSSPNASPTEGPPVRGTWSRSGAVSVEA